MSAPERTTEILEEARDAFTGALGVMDNDHREIHEGKSFSVIGNTGSLAAAAVYVVTLLTPVASAGKYIHLRPAKLLSTANLLAVQVYEGTSSTDGSAYIPINRNRNSSNLAGTVVTVGVANPVYGTIVGQDGAGAAGTGNASGGSAGGTQEIVLKPGTLYLVKFTNIGAATATTGYFDLPFYEESRG